MLSVLYLSFLSAVLNNRQKRVELGSAGQGRRLGTRSSQEASGSHEGGAGELWSLAWGQGGRALTSFPSALCS